MLNKINNITNLFRMNVQQSSLSPLSGTAMDWYKTQNANNSVLVPEADPFKVNDMFNKPLHKSIGNPTGFSLQDNPLSESLASGKTDFLGGLKNISGGIGDFAKGAGLSTGSMIDMGAGVLSSGLSALGMEGAELKSGVGKTLDFASKLPLEMIPGVGVPLKAATVGLSLINNHFGSKSRTHGTDEFLDTTGYTKGFNPNAGKKHGLFDRRNRKRSNRLTDRLDAENLMKSVPGYQDRQNTLHASNTGQVLQDLNYTQLRGGVNTGMVLAKSGGVLNLKSIIDKAKKNNEKLKDDAENIISYKDILELTPEFIPPKKEKEAKTKSLSYKEGGSLTKEDRDEVIGEIINNNKNVIPEGAFHSRLNHYNKEGITRKGIPVVTKDSDGGIIQHAEVERNEIIFHKEATDRIEELYKKYKNAESDEERDKIKIECGKYVSKQIIENTDDRTGLIKEISNA